MKPGVVIEAGGGHHGEDCHQTGWRLSSRLPLHVTQIGASLRSYFAVRPWPLGGPFDCVEAVLCFISKGIPTPFRFKAAPHVLHNNGIPAPGEADEVLMN